MISVPAAAVAFPLQVGGHAHAARRWTTGTEWHFDPLVPAGARRPSTVAYAVGWWRLRQRGGRDRATIPRGDRFLLGINILVLALVSPLHHLGMDYLLSAHMVQHMLVGDVAPILLCLGVYGPMRFFVDPPADPARAGGPRMRPVIRQLGRPRSAFWAWVRGDGGSGTSRPSTSRRSTTRCCTTRCSSPSSSRAWPCGRTSWRWCPACG